MAEIPDLTQLTNKIFSDLLVKLKPLLYILLILFIIYIFYKLIKFLLAWKKERREKLTYLNTEKILSKLETIEKKIDELAIKKAEKSKEEKPRKEKREKRKLKTKSAFV